VSVPISPEDLVRRARQLYDAREYAAVAELLAPVGEEQLVGEPVLAFLLAGAWQRLGEREPALALLRRLSPVLRRMGNDPLHRRCLNLEGVLLFGFGEIGKAEAVWGRLLEMAMRDGDEAMVARANNNFGVVYTVRWQRELALASYGRSVAAYQRLSYLRGLAQAHSNLGIIFREMDFLAESEQHFEQAVEYARADGSRDEEGRATVERALLLGYRRDLSLARATAERALGLWRDLGDPAGEGESQRVLGILAVVGGEWDEASARVDAALEIAARTHTPLLEAEALEVRAVIEGRRGDGKAADASRARGEELFGAMGAGAWGTQVRARLERISPAS
jgi:tetratricopeptide (TPR) repeat protein